MNDAERAGDKAASGLSMTTKLIIMGGVLVACVVIYAASSGGDESGDGAAPALPTPPAASKATSALPFDIGGWVNKGEGGVGVSGNW